jgi:putative FmdB family regulatory protein
MPLYEYLCKKCGQSFAFTMTISEHEKKRVQCPHCNGTEIVPQFQSFFRRLPKRADDGSSPVVQRSSSLRLAISLPARLLEAFSA